MEASLAACALVKIALVATMPIVVLPLKRSFFPAVVNSIGLIIAPPIV
jgi:hypothetical protein